MTQDLELQIDKAQQLVRTDSLQMSIGELATMYENGELVINPEFQRLFRWELEQKARLIESILWESLSHPYLYLKWTTARGN